MYDGGMMIRCANMIPLTMMYMMSPTFGLLGVITSGFTIEELGWV